MTGRVKWWNDVRGMGFIKSDEDRSRDVFAHYSHIAGDGRKTLKDNQRVEFDLYESDKGLVAKNIKAVE